MNLQTSCAHCGEVVPTESWRTFCKKCGAPVAEPTGDPSLDALSGVIAHLEKEIQDQETFLAQSERHVTEYRMKLGELRDRLVKVQRDYALLEPKVLPMRVA